MKTLTGIIALMLALLFGASNLVVAAEKTVAPAAPAAKKIEAMTLKQMIAKVTQVNPTGNTFTVMSKGKAFTFGSKSLKVLPKVGEIIDITYTQNPGGPMEATTINSTKSQTF